MIKAKKSLGQNFLTDRDILDKITCTVPIKDKHILEVGPGTGNLTSFILKKAPKRLTMPDSPEPTSFELSKDYYVDAVNIVEEVLRMLGKENMTSEIDVSKRTPHDVPGDWFKGPF